MNLLGFFTIARLAENLKIDLWNFETDGKSIKRAVDWLVPFAKGDKKWTNEQIKSITYKNTVKILHLAAQKYDNSEYENLVKKLSTESFQKAVENLEF